MPILKRVGLGISVPQAPAYIRSAVHAITNAEAGNGAVKEIADYLLNSQGKLEAFLG